MKIELKASFLTKNGVVPLAGKIVEVKKERKSHYIFEYQGEEFKVQKKFAIEVKD